jgi:hypothetical protein
MKNIAFILLFLVTATMGAQTITNDTLQGEWTLRKISLSGNLADLKTGEIQISDAFARQKGQSKEALTEQFKKRLPTMNGFLQVYTNGRMQYQIGAKSPTQGSFVIIEDNGKQYLADQYSGSKIEIYFKDQFLWWEVLGSEGLITMAWERGAQK